MKGSHYDIIVVTGATATGKTRLSAILAAGLDGEIISADSRQVYRGMDLGTGKDYGDYSVNGKEIPYHLIDIRDAGYKYSVFEYQQDFLNVYSDIKTRGRLAVVCGGSGMYIDSILNGYKLIKVPHNEALRAELESLSLTELKGILSGYKNLHNRSDVDNIKRAVRAIEIAEYYQRAHKETDEFPKIESLIVALRFDREQRRDRISHRLKARLSEGLVEEVKSLIDSGVSSDVLIYYGLEYKFITLYLTGVLGYQEMFSRLESAIHQFAKRQMTWFRMMEKRGTKINWIDGELKEQEKVERILELYYRERRKA